MPAPLPLLLLPGMLCDARLFDAQRQRLGPERPVTVADLSQDNTIERMARRALATVPDGPMAVAGLSLGGIVAMEIVRLAPERVGRLALIATNHRGPTAPFIALRSGQMERLAASPDRMVALKDIVVHEMKGQYLGAKRRGDRALLDLVVAMALDAGPDVFIRQAQALMTRRDQTETLARYQGPVLLLCGGDDELCPPATHRAMQGLMPQADLAELPQIGHLVTLENPQASSDALARWLAADR